MQPTLAQQQEYDAARDELIHRCNVSGGGTFNYGFNSFPPFLVANGHVEGPLAVLMNDAAADLGLQPNPIRCDWENFSELLANDVYTTVAAPMMRIHQRPFSIVPMFELNCGALFMSKDIDRRIGVELRRVGNKIRSDLRAIANNKSPEIHMGNIDEHVRAMATAGECGFAVGNQFFEDLQLQRFNAPIKKRLPGISLSDEALDAANNGFVCVIDLVTASEIETKVGTAVFRKDYGLFPLLGAYVPIEAGLPYLDAETGVYFHHRWKFDVGGTRTRVLDELPKPNGVTFATPDAFRVLREDELPDHAQPPSAPSSRDGRLYHGLAERMFRSGTALVSSAATVSPPSLPAVPVPRGYLPAPADELGDLLNSIDSSRRGDAFAAVKMALREIAPTQQYVIDRYDELVDQKYRPAGLSAAEQVEYERLKDVLNEMEKPFYETVLSSLRAIREGEQ